MKYLKIYEAFQSNSEVNFCVQNLLDIGFDYWESGINYYNGRINTQL